MMIASSALWRDLREQVAGQQHRAATVGEHAQELTHPLDPAGVEPVERLVEDEHLRLTDQRGSEVEPLAHAQREASRPAMSGLGQPYLRQHVVDPVLAHPGLGGDDAQVVACAPVRVEALVEHGTHDSQRVRQVAVAQTADEGGAGVRFGEPEQHPHRGGLPRAVCSQEGGDPAPRTRAR